MNGLTVSQAVSEATGILEAAGCESAALDASVLLAHILGVPRGALMLAYDKLLINSNIVAFNEAVSRRAQKEPIAYIVGSKEFWSLDFFVTRDTLIPRPDSETLIEVSLKLVKNRAKAISILDIGTGTGCLLIALLKELPQASGVGVDINKGALAVAHKNAVHNAVDARTEFKASHWCDAVDGTFDLIISNPPYIAETDITSLMQDVVSFEPHTALFAGTDGMDAYSVLAPQVAARLNPGGFCVFEAGVGQAGDIMELLKAQGLVDGRTAKDLQGIPRAVIAHKPH